MRKINLIVIHCSATPAGRDITAADVDRMHRQRKPPFTMIGYHWFVRLSGQIERGRAEATIGAHVTGYNAQSIGVCYAGGTDARGRSTDTRTGEQKAALEQLLRELLGRYPEAKICGHRDLSPDTNHDGVISRFEWIKDCPCFDVAGWLAETGLGAHALRAPVAA